MGVGVGRGNIFEISTGMISMKKIYCETQYLKIAELFSLYFQASVTCGSIVHVLGVVNLCAVVC